MLRMGTELGMRRVGCGQGIRNPTLAANRNQVRSLDGFLGDGLNLRRGFDERRASSLCRTVGTVPIWTCRSTCKSPTSSGAARLGSSPMSVLFRDPERTRIAPGHARCSKAQPARLPSTGIDKVAIAIPTMATTPSRRARPQVRCARQPLASLRWLDDASHRYCDGFHDAWRRLSLRSRSPDPRRLRHRPRSGGRSCGQTERGRAHRLRIRRRQQLVGQVFREVPAQPERRMTAQRAVVFHLAARLRQADLRAGELVEHLRRFMRKLQRELADMLDASGGRLADLRHIRFERLQPQQLIMSRRPRSGGDLEPLGVQIWSHHAILDPDMRSAARS